MFFNGLDGPGSDSDFTYFYLQISQPHPTKFRDSEIRFRPVVR
jgi:hypothetical protein